MNALRPALAPEPVTLEGRYCRLEPLARSHAVELFSAIEGPESEARHRWLFEEPPASAARLAEWIEATETEADKLFFAVIDGATGRCAGRHALMRIVPEHGVIEIGSILWGDGIARTRKATEAFFLTASYVFDTLGYRRFEWKCNDLNTPSKRAATRFGFTFEGVFRQHMIVKGANRDTAWFAIIDSEWPELKEKFEAWLAPENFDADGTARARLATPRYRTDAEPRP